jgi:hypothetical protein
MKNLKRFAILGLSLMLVLGLVGTSYAQNKPCLSLSEEDCELYYNLPEEFPLSSAFALNVDIQAAVDEGNTPEEIAMAFVLSGAYVVDMEAIDGAVAEFSSTSVLDVSPRTFLNLARGVLSGFDAELEFDYEFPPEMDVPPIGPFNVWLVDGVAYVDFTPFNAFDPTLEGVRGINLFDLIEMPLDQVEMGDLLAGLEDMDFDSFDFESMGMASSDSSNPFANFAPIDLSNELSTFVTVERLDDDSVDGTDVIVFMTTVDLEAAMQVDAIVASSYQSAVQSGFPADIDQEAWGEALAQALAGSVMTVTEKINPETGVRLQVTMEMNVLLDIEPIAALTGEQASGTVTINVALDYQLSDVNAVEEIVLPEGAEEIPVEALLGGF